MAAPFVFRLALGATGLAAARGVYMAAQEIGTGLAAVKAGNEREVDAVLRRLEGGYRMSAAGRCTSNATSETIAPGS